MTQRTIRCGIFGALERDLSCLSELHRQESVEISFIFEPREGAVGLEIAEILGIPRFRRGDELPPSDDVDCLVVSEPRARFQEELDDYIQGGTRILTPSEALKTLCGRKVDRKDTANEADPYTIEDTLKALERLFDRQALLKFLLEVAVKATNSTAGSIMLYSEEAKELYIAHALGLSERVVKNTRQKLGDGISGWVAQTREPQLLHKPSERALYAHDRDRLDITSAISVPLVWEEKLLGVLNVSTGKGGHSHSQSDLLRLKTLSRRLSRVLSESLKLQEVQMRQQSTRFRDTMREIANKDITTGEKLSILSRYLSELIGAETLEIFLTTTEGDWFVLGGSNRVLTPTQERIRYQRGALTTAFNEQRCVVLTEGGDSDDSTGQGLSLVYCPMLAQDSGGVIGAEFSARFRLDEFMLIQEELAAEIGRFVASELRERRLRRKLDAFARISDAAAALLGCHAMDDLTNILSGIVSNVLESRRVSVRLKRSPDAKDLVISRTMLPGGKDSAWEEEDEQRYRRLARRREPFTIAFLDFESIVRTGPSEHHALIAFPIADEDEFFGGIIAYDKRSSDPVEEAVFTDLDREILEHLTRLVLPVIDTIYTRQPTKGPVDGATYESVLAQNRERFRSVCANEIARSDRYHHSFAVVLFKVKALDQVFEENAKRAFKLIDEITQGIRTRTRKTDYGCWIDRNSYVMLSLEGTKRIRFLISRATTYLAKDLAEVGAGKDDVLIGTAMYPGTSRTANDLLQEARKSLQPFNPE